MAAHLVAHFEKRVEAMDGKAMIVCKSRRIAMDLCKGLIARFPDCASDKDSEDGKDEACVVKVGMTDIAADGPDL